MSCSRTRLRGPAPVDRGGDAQDQGVGSRPRREHGQDRLAGLRAIEHVRERDAGVGGSRVADHAVELGGGLVARESASRRDGRADVR